MVRYVLAAGDIPPESKDAGAVVSTRIREYRKKEGLESGSDSQSGSDSRTGSGKGSGSDSDSSSGRRIPRRGAGGSNGKNSRSRSLSRSKSRSRNSWLFIWRGESGADCRPAKLWRPGSQLVLGYIDAGFIHFSIIGNLSPRFSRWCLLHFGFLQIERDFCATWAQFCKLRWNLCQFRENFQFTEDSMLKYTHIYNIFLQHFAEISNFIKFHEFLSQLHKL